MAFTINTNISASVANAAVVQNSRHLGSAMEQLSTGRKINSAGDNAAGLAITTRMTTQIRLLSQTISNTHDACLLYTSPSPRDVEESRMPSSA